MTDRASLLRQLEIQEGRIVRFRIDLCFAATPFTLGVARGKLIREIERRDATLAGLDRVEADELSRDDPERSHGAIPCSDREWTERLDEIAPKAARPAAAQVA